MANDTVHERMIDVGGDPFAYAGKTGSREPVLGLGDCPSPGCACFGGFVTISYEDADGCEVFEPVPCRRCSDSR